MIYVVMYPNGVKIGIAIIIAIPKQTQMVQSLGHIAFFVVVVGLTMLSHAVLHIATIAILLVHIHSLAYV